MNKKLLLALDDRSSAKFALRVEAFIDLRLVEEFFADFRLQDGQLRLKQAAGLQVLGLALGGAPAPLVTIHWKDKGLLLVEQLYLDLRNVDHGSPPRANFIFKSEH